MPRSAWLFRVLFVSMLVGLGVMGCADVNPTNPFDPTTPSAQQAKGSVRGRVELPRGNALTLLSDGSAELLDANDANAVFAQVALTADAPPADGAEGAGDAGAISGPGGAFVFESVPAGRYRVRVRVPTFSVPTAEADVGIGAQVDVGTLYATLNGNSVIEGVITLDPPRPEGAAGVTIEVVNTPLTTQTNSAGAYRLAVGAGTHDLRVTGPSGYVPDSIIGVRVDEGQTVSAPALTLRGQPARVRGLVRVETLDPALLGQVSLSLQSLDNPGVAFESPPPATLVDEPTRGTYTFDGLAPGAYAVQAALEGFVSAQAVVNLRLGDDVNAPELELVPNLQAGAFLEGVALLDPAPAEGSAGVVVELVDGFATAQTNSAGAYRLPVPPRAGLSLRFTGPAGYASASLDGLSASAGDTTTVPPVTLVGRPGGVEGLVRIDERFNSPELFSRISIALLSVSDAGREVARLAPVLANGSTTSGTFRFDGVAPGNYVVQTNLNGFISVVRPASVRLGETTTVGEVFLTQDLSGQAATITGVARRGCGAACGHGGILVEAIGTPFVTLTGSDGAFTLSAVAGSYTLRFSSAGYSSAERETGAIDVGQTVSVGSNDAPVVLAYLPAAIQGRVVRTTAAGALVPAEGITVNVTTPAGAAIASTQSNAAGEFLLTGFEGGAQVVSASRAGYVSAQTALVSANGETTRLGDLVLALERGALAGTMTLSGYAGRGGATVRATRRAAVGDEPVVRSAVSLAPTDTYALNDLPVGTYDLLVVAEGFRPLEQAGVVVASAQTTTVSGALAARVARVSAPAVTNASPVELTVEADPDMTQVRTWLNSASPPAGLAFSPLPANGRVPVALPSEGAYTVYAQVATAAFVNAVEGNEYLRAEATLFASVLLDTTAPTLTARHEPVGDAREGYAQQGQPTTLVLSGFDSVAGSGLTQVRVQVDAAQAAAQAFAPRLSVPALAAGAHTVTLVAEDAAGNRSAPAAVSLKVDAAAPVAALGFRADQFVDRDGNRVVQGQRSGPNGQIISGFGLWRLTSTDADAAPLEYRVYEVGQPARDFAPLSAGQAAQVALEGVTELVGESTHRLTGDVRDAAGRVTNLGEIAFVVDASTPAPTLTVTKAADGAEIAANARVRLVPNAMSGAYLVNVRVDAPGTSELLTARLTSGAAAAPTCEIDPRVSTACTLSNVPLNVAAGNVESVDLVVSLVDRVGNVSSDVMRSFTVDIDPPREPSLTLPASGRTNANPLGVRISATGAVSYTITGAGVVGGAVVQNAVYPVRPNITLTNGDGDKAVTVTFTDEVGNTSQVSGSVLYDSTSPAFQFEILQRGISLFGPVDAAAAPPNPLLVTNNETLTLRVTPALEADCPSVDACLLALRVSTLADFSDAPFAALTRDTSVRLPRVDGVYPLYLQVRDLAGNVRTARTTVQIQLDLTPPAVPDMRRTYVGPAKIRLEATLPADDDLAFLVVERQLPDGNAAWRTVALYPAIADDDTLLSGVDCAYRLQTLNCSTATSAECVQVRGTVNGRLVLMEDREVTLGQRHVYRVQAFDALGNGSGWSSPVEAGAPMGPPNFDVFDVTIPVSRDAADPVDNALTIRREARWTPPAGAATTTDARYTRYDLNGAPASETDILDPEAGAFDLANAPTLTPYVIDPNQPLTPEDLRMEFGNFDQSQVWSARMLGPESWRESLLSGEAGVGEAAAMLGAPVHPLERGTTYALQATRSGAIQLGIIRSNGLTTQYTLTGAAAFAATSVMDVVEAGARRLALTFDDRDGSLRLLDFSDPNAVSVVFTQDLCPGACPAVRVAGQVAVSGNTTYVAYHNPVTRTLYYDSFGLAEAPAFVQIDAGTWSGSDLRMHVSGNAPYFVSIERKAANMRRLVHIKPSGANWIKTTLVDDIGMPDSVTAPILDTTTFFNQLALSTTAIAVWTRQSQLAVAPFTTTYTLERGSFSLTAPIAPITPRVAYTGADSCLCSVASSLRSPRVERLGNGQEVIFAASSPRVGNEGPATLFVFQAPEELPTNDFAYYRRSVVGNFTNSDAFGPFLALAEDSDERLRVFARSADGELLEFGLDPRTHPDYFIGRATAAATQMRGISVLESVAGVLNFAGLRPDFNNALVGVGESGSNLYSFGFEDTNDRDLIRAVESARFVTPSTAMARQGANQYVLYVASPTAASTTAGLYLRQLNDSPVNVDPPAATELQAATGFAPYVAVNSVRQRPGEFRLLLSNDGALHTVWQRVDARGANELVYWRRATNNVAATTTVYRTVVNGAVPAVPAVGSDLATNAIIPVEVADNEVSAVFVSGTSVYALDLTGPLANNAGSPHTPLDLGVLGAELLDAIVNDEGDLFVLYLLGAELRMGRLPRPAGRVTGETWRVDIVGNGKRDTARLVLNAGEPVGVVYSRTDFDPFSQIPPGGGANTVHESVTTLFVRPERDQVPMVIGPRQDWLTVGVRPSLYVLQGNYVASDIVTNGVTPGLAAGETGLVERMRLRQVVEPVVRLERVDGQPMLGVSGDADEDGVLNANDACPFVFNPTGDAAACACTPPEAIAPDGGAVAQ